MFSQTVSELFLSPLTRSWADDLAFAAEKSTFPAMSFLQFMRINMCRVPSSFTSTSWEQKSTVQTRSEESLHPNFGKEICFWKEWSYFNPSGFLLFKIKRASFLVILQQTGGESLPSVSRWHECPPLKSLSQTWLSRSPWSPRCTAGEPPWSRALQRFKKTLERKPHRKWSWLNISEKHREQ